MIRTRPGPAVFRVATSWTDQAACAAHPDPLWTEPSTIGHPRRRAEDSRARRRLAVAICAGCPVRVPCLVDALGEDVPGHTAGPYPVRGGFTAAERVLWARMSSSPAPPSG